MKRKYLCIGGYVLGNDGGFVYVNAHRLPRLYKIKLADCHCLDPQEYEKYYKGTNHGYIELRADPTGKYELPKEIK